MRSAAEVISDIAKSTRTSKVMLGLIDFLLVNVSLYAALFVRFEGAVPFRFFSIYLDSIAVYSFVNIISFAAFGLYRLIWKYASIMALLSVALSVSLASAVFLLLQVVSGHRLPYGVMLAAYLMNLVLIGGSRMSWRVLREMLFKPLSADRKKVLVVGAGDAGDMILREMLRVGRSEYDPAVVVDDDPRKQGMRLHGLTVRGGTADIPKLVRQFGIDEIVIAVPSAKGAQMRNIVAHCKKAGVPYMTLPTVAELMDGRVGIGKLRRIDVTDLLRRDQVSFDLAAIAPLFNAKVVLVTGAGGSIGSELCRQIASLGPARILLVGQGENSIYEIKAELRKLFGNIDSRVVIASVKDQRKIDSIMREHRPDIVFHAAAYKHVDIMEEHPEEAFANNVIGTLNVAESAVKHGVGRFVNISSDKAVEPVGVMGASKRLAELLVLGFSMNGAGAPGATRFMTVRFGNVLGSRGSIVRVFRRQIEGSEPITITHPDVRRFFMTIPEAVMLIINAAAMGKGGEIFVLDMGEPIKIVDLAKYMIELSGLDAGDYPMRYIGLRPGEKLSEKLFHDAERPSPTAHEKILLARSDFRRLDALKKGIKGLHDQLPGLTRQQVKERILELVRTCS